MTKAFSGGPSYDFTLGRKYAKLWRDAHENFAENPALAKTMDLYNNNVGQNVVTKSTYSTAQLITACMNKVTKGQCKRYNSAGNALIKTDGKGRI